MILATECFVIENPMKLSNMTNASAIALQSNTKTIDQPKKSSSQNSFPVPITDQSHSKTEKSTQLQKLIQQLYLAQAQVQLEASEIAKAQAVAAAGQKDLEEATNNVMIHF